MTYVTCVNTDCFWPTQPAISECVFTYISADVVVSDKYLPVPFGTRCLVILHVIRTRGYVIGEFFPGILPSTSQYYHPHVSSG